LTLHQSGAVATDAIGILGTGRLANALGRLLRESGLPVRAVAGRDRKAAEEAAIFIGGAEAMPIGELPQLTGRVLIAISDDAIPEVACELAAVGLKDSIILHTSGAAGPEALASLRHNGNAVGVLHPLQAVPDARRGMETLRGAAYAFAGDDLACDWARLLIRHVDGKPLAVDPGHWRHYHAAAVMASNYNVTLVDAALELMEIAGLGQCQARDALAPLIRGAMENILLSNPAAALTGPIRRGDAGTVRGHLAALEAASPETRRLYASAGLRTVLLARRAGLPASSADELVKILAESLTGHE
jgi:predicted short-subunit dehydrogenase-like oxidoreductase (DUF2520 family)